MRRKYVMLLGAFLVVGLVFVSVPGHAASLKQDLDRNINDKDLNGYKVKGWIYKKDSREFVVYVEDGSRWTLNHATNPLFAPVVAVVVGADTIFSSHSTPSTTLSKLEFA